MGTSVTMASWLVPARANLVSTRTKRFPIFPTWSAIERSKRNPRHESNKLSKLSKLSKMNKRNKLKERVHVDVEMITRVGGARAARTTSINI